MFEMRRKTDAGPSNPRTVPGPDLSLQRVGPTIILDPEAATLPASARNDNAVMASLVVLIHVHLDLDVALERESRERSPSACLSDN